MLISHCKVVVELSKALPVGEQRGVVEYRFGCSGVRAMGSLAAGEGEGRYVGPRMGKQRGEVVQTLGVAKKRRVSPIADLPHVADTLQPGGASVLEGLVIPKIPECAPGFGLPGASAELPVDFESLLQSLAGRFGLVECCVQEPDAVGVRAHETDQRAVDRARVSHGMQVIEEALAQLVVAQRDGGRSHLADKD
jgi:hypothetical protein